VGLTREELDLVERQLMYIQDQRGAVTFARKQARKEGLAEGIEMTQRSIAQKLLPTLDDDSISQITGLSLEAIRSLRRPD
jgi:hypothetical protein